MKSKILLTIFLAFYLTMFSQSVSDVIYIDLNSSSKSLSEIEDEIRSITKSSNSFLLYISNGGEPIYTSLHADIASSLEQMYLLNPRSSNFKFDIPQINKLMRKNNFAENINTISSQTSLDSHLTHTRKRTHRGEYTCGTNDKTTTNTVREWTCIHTQPSCPRQYCQLISEITVRTIGCR